MLRLAVIGAGRIAPSHIEGINATPGAILAGITDCDLRRARSVAEGVGLKTVYRSVEECLAADSVEAVIICTSTESHYSLARAALDAGKHVLIEKPMSTTFAEAVSLVAQAREQDVRLMVGQTMRFMPVFDEVKRLVDSGVLGQPLHMIERRLTYRTEVLSGWEQSPRLLLSHWGSHSVDLVHWLFGTRALAVFAASTSARTAYPGEDDCLVALIFENGIHVGLHYSFHARQAHHDICILGTEGTLEVERIARVRLNGIEIVQQRDGSDFQPAFIRQTAEFVRAIVEGRDPVPSGADALETMRVLEAAYHSAAVGEMMRPCHSGAAADPDLSAGSLGSSMEA